MRMLIFHEIFFFFFLIAKHCPFHCFPFHFYHFLWRDGSDSVSLIDAFKQYFYVSTLNFKIIWCQGLWKWMKSSNVCYFWPNGYGIMCWKWQDNAFFWVIPHHNVLIIIGYHITIYIITASLNISNLLECHDLIWL